MPEKPEVNKSEAIRNYYKSNPTAKTKEVVDALAKAGITVATGLVTNVKSTHNKRQAAKKAAKTATKTATTSDAKTNGVNKTQAVRDYLKAHKKAGRKEVVMPWPSRVSRSRPTTSGPSRPRARGGGGRSRRSSRMSLPRAASVSPRSRRPLYLPQGRRSVAVAKQALAAAVEIKKIV